MITLELNDSLLIIIAFPPVFSIYLSRFQVLNIVWQRSGVWDGEGEETDGENGQTSLSVDVGALRHSHTFIQLITNAPLSLSVWVPCRLAVGA